MWKILISQQSIKKFYHKSSIHHFILPRIRRETTEILEHISRQEEVDHVIDLKLAYQSAQRYRRDFQLQPRTNDTTITT
jgi:hypothetical protein